MRPVGHNGHLWTGAHTQNSRGVLLLHLTQFHSKKRKPSICNIYNTQKRRLIALRMLAYDLSGCEICGILFYLPHTTGILNCGLDSFFKVQCQNTCENLDIISSYFTKDYTYELLLSFVLENFELASGKVKDPCVPLLINGRKKVCIYIYICV